MRWINSIKTKLRDELPPAANRLALAIFDAAFDDEGQLAEEAVGKKEVLEALAQKEKKTLDPRTVRQRLLTINRAVVALDPDNGDQPILRIRSTKYTFKVELNDQAVKKMARQQDRHALSAGAHSDRLESTGDTIAPEFTKPIYSVFLSHGTETPDVERIVESFAQRLRHKLKHLPDRWHNQFAVDLVFDRHDFNNRSADFASQVEARCDEAAFAIFLVNPKWCQSKACQREAEIFRARASSAGESHCLGIVLNSQREFLDACTKKMPLMPITWQDSKGKSYINLISLWEEDSASLKDAFVDEVMRQICEHLEIYGTRDPEPPKDPDGSLSGKSRRLHRAIAKAPIAKAEFDPAHRLENWLAPDGSESNRRVAERGIPAVDTLYQWVTQDRTTRHVVVLGGFGMGKTTTMQLLSERLHIEIKDGKDLPTPIYLDFRRLVPLSRHGESIDADLDTLILKALHSDARRRIDSDDVIELIRDERCVVIFDGLDEVGNRIGREAAADLYRQFLSLIPADVSAVERKDGTVHWDRCGIKTILTCRTHFFRSFREQDSLLDGSHRAALFKRAQDSRDKPRSQTKLFYMQPFRLAQIEDLFRRVLGAKSGARAFSLITKIHDLPGLASRPIMARFISEIADTLIARHEAGKTINIATVYSELFELGLARDADKRPLLKTQDRADVLEGLAAHLHLNGLGPQKAEELERWFDGFAHAHDGISLLLKSGHNTRDLLHTELENASFLVRGNDDRFRFAHTSYYEYFLARILMQALVKAERFVELIDKVRSAETVKFLEALAQERQESERLREKLTTVLQSDASRGARWFCFQALCHDDLAKLPDNANLSDFDLRNRKISQESGRVQMVGVNFTRAQLNKLYASCVDFRECKFARATVGSATFLDCHFQGARGAPLGLESARGLHTALPDAWRGVTRAREQYWQARRADEPLKITTRFAIWAIAFSPDGTQVLTGGMDGSAHLWDAHSGAEQRRFEGHSRPVNSAAFSPDGRQVLTGSDDGSARLWDVCSGAEQRRFEGHGDWVNSVAFSPDGAQVLTGGMDGSARLWDAHSGVERLRFEGHGEWVNSVAFSPDGTQILTGGEDGSARLWDARTGVERRRFEGHSHPMNSAAFSPDGAKVLTGSDDGSARLWDARSGAEQRRFEGHGRPINSVVFSPDGAQVLAGSDDGSARLWDASSGAEQRRFRGHRRPVEGVAFSPDGTQVLTGANDGSARLWDARSGAEQRRFEGHGDWVYSVAFSPDGTQVLTGGEYAGARLSDARSGAEQRRFEGHGHPVGSAAFSRDGTQVLTGGMDGSARLWDVRSGAEQRRFEGHGFPVNIVAFSPDGTRVLTGGMDGSARLWDAYSGAEQRRFEGHGSPVNSAAFSPDGRQVLTGGDDGSARLWDVCSGAEQRRFEGHGDWVNSVAFSPDGAQVLTGGEDGSARLWDASCGAEQRRFEGHGRPVDGVAFSPDGTQVLTGGEDGSARLWDARSGAEQRRFEGHGNWVTSVAFSPDGAQVLVGASSGLTTIYDAASKKEHLRLWQMRDAWARLDLTNHVIAGGGALWRYAN